VKTKPSPVQSPCALPTELVERARYHPGWTFRLEELRTGTREAAWFLFIRIKGFDSYHPEKGPEYAIDHRFAVPAMYEWTEVAWQWWILECILLILRHEACEGLFFEAPDGSLVNPFEPPHSAGAYYYSFQHQRGQPL
jgi:hypothetical protein